MHTYKTRVAWKREGAAFTDHKYSRRHEWAFDGGVTVPASSSPLVVALPYSVAEAVDPEEALVASASSCHMLWFLWVAAKRGFVIDTYVDDASGTIAKNADGKTAMTRIVLRPAIAFAGDRRPSKDELHQMHEIAHDECFIASSLKTEIVVETPQETMEGY